MNCRAVRRHILLRLDAPLMAFGAPIVDQHGVTGDVPLPSMIAGLLANGLGYRDKPKLPWLVFSRMRLSRNSGQRLKRRSKVRRAIPRCK